MRGFDIAMTALALRASPTKPPTHQRRLVPAMDDPGAAFLDRAAISHQRAALVASLWPEPTRQCVASPSYETLPAPAAFGVVHRVTWPASNSSDPRALQGRLQLIFPAIRHADPELVAAAA
ncbi:MAG: hypothetical protein H7124_11545 [Phycisphaerales bacterium]|nr:hypothetical protein [Hyphomonadaceae bacterium]